MAEGNQVLISEFTYKHVADRVEAVQVGLRQFKGKQQEVMVYEVFSEAERLAQIADAALSPKATEQVVPETEEKVL